MLAGKTTPAQAPATFSKRRKRVFMARIPAFLQMVALSFLPLLSGCWVLFQDCRTSRCSNPLIVKNESNQAIKVCESEYFSGCRDIAIGSSLKIGEFYSVRPNGSWYSDIRLPWLVVCERAVRVDELRMPGKPVGPEFVESGDAVVTVDQAVKQKVCGS